MTNTEALGHSRGRPNQANEDAFEANDHLGLYVVCDGEGREEGGEIASRLAVSAIHDYVSRLVAGRRFRAASFSEDTAAAAIEAAFDAMFREAERNTKVARMTTTITMLLLSGERAVVGHTGDSRLYLATDDRLDQLTVDHPSTRATGGVTVVGVDTFSFRTRPGDVCMLCTDGLLSALDDEAWVLSQLRRRAVSDAAERLLERAASAEPDADATVVIVRVGDETHHVAVQHSSPWAAGAFAEFAFAGA